MTSRKPVRRPKSQEFLMNLTTAKLNNLKAQLTIKLKLYKCPHNQLKPTMIANPPVLITRVECNPSKLIPN